MVDREALYARLPIALQEVACTLQGWMIERRRHGGDFQAILRAVEARGSWSQERTIEFRDRRLRAFIDHAYRTTSFYRRRLDNAGVRPTDIRGIDDLGSLPVLTKEEVQDQYPELRSSAVPDRAITIAHTSGTTGGGLRFATTSASDREQWAVWWRYRRWHGIQRGTWCGYFAGRSVVPITQTGPPFWRTNRAGRQILFSGYHLSDANLPLYVAELRRRRPPWIHGYPSLLALLAGYLVETGQDLGYPVLWVTTGAENLLAQQSQLIERGLGVSPLQHYGMAEAVANASQCTLGAMHLDEDLAAVELIPSKDGGERRVLGTNLSNPALPLIRYDVQDVARLADSSCPCGRPGRILTKVDGRLEDYVVLHNGARVGRMDHVFKDQVRIREAQIQQDRIGEILIRVIPRPGYGPEDERDLIQEARKRLGPDTGIRVEHVERLPRTVSGKLRFVVSTLQGGRADGFP